MSATTVAGYLVLVLGHLSLVLCGYYSGFISHGVCDSAYFVASLLSFYCYGLGAPFLSVNVFCLLLELSYGLR